jgi:hypothetical protein
MRIRLMIAPAILVLLAAYGVAAQNTQSAPPQNPAPAPSQPAPSLADAARKAREAKKTEPKNTKVFTNDNIPDAGNINVVGADAAPADGSAAAPPPAAAKSTLAQEEQGWRDRFGKARAKLARDQAELDVLQREMGKLQLGFYPNDPVKQMQQDLTRSDIINQQAKIDKKLADIAADKGAISDLEDALRKSGGDPGWSR